MDRERAELHLRRLAEAALRDAAAGHGRPPYSVSTLGARPAPDAALAHVAQALVAIGAVDRKTAEEIQVDLQLALAVRRGSKPRSELMRSPAFRRRVARLLRSAPAAYSPAGPTWPATRHGQAGGPGQASGSGQVPHRIAPVGMMIPVVTDDCRGELYLLAYLHTAAYARFTVVGWLRAPNLLLPRPAPVIADELTITDGNGNEYRVGYTGSSGVVECAGELVLDPAPAPDVDWLDVAVGSTTRRVSLAPPTQVPAVQPASKMPGEQYLHGVAATILAGVPTFPGDRGYGAARHGLAQMPAQLADGLGDVIAGFLAAGALDRHSLVPGQLVTLCESLGMTGHDISAPAERELPPQWVSMLSYYLRRKPEPVPLNDGAAGAAIAFPPVDGVTLSVLGVHNGEDGTVLHASALVPDGHPALDLGSPPDLPLLWLRDDGGRWHTVRRQLSASGLRDEVTMRLEVVPPLPRTSAVEIVVSGTTAEARATLPLRWRLGHHA